MILRQYQTDAINALWAYWRSNPRGAPLLVCPTGSGKSLICASVIKQITDKYPKYRFLIATHTKEIVDQNSRELQKLTTEPIGIYSAGLGSKQIRRVTFANIQSVYKRSEIESDMLIIDECHLLSKNENSMYQKLISNLQKKNRDLKILGLTATPMRMDQGSLISTGSIFTDIAYNISIRELIDNGFLCPIVSMSKEAVDLSEVKMSGYDFNQGDLEKAFNCEALIDLHCKDIIKNAKDRKHWLIFCAGIDHAKEVSERFNQLGVSADYVTGEMVNFERDNKINRFKNGTIQALCNVGILTTGFNYPDIECIILLRATKSTSLYIQSVGRGSRIASNKLDCLILDYGGNISRHGPIDAISISNKQGKEKGEITIAPHKACPICGCVVPLGNSICPSCEYKFPDSTKQLTIKPSSASVLSDIEEHQVSFRTVKKHIKRGDPEAPHSLKIEYICGLKSFMEFLCLDHQGFARQKAAERWIQRRGAIPIPKTVDEGILRQSELMPVKSIKVIKDGKYYRILSVAFQTEAERKKEEEKLMNEMIY